MPQSKLSWRSDETPQELAGLLTVLGEEYPISEGGRGLKLKFRKQKAPGSVSRVVRSRGEVTVEYTTVASAARGIGTALARLDGGESSPFLHMGIMLDVSRNMVMKPEHLKKWLRRLALAGYDHVLLYSEDTYELEGEPFFGYLRGAYTLEELRELDSYAASLGIELVGCIQTLAHLEQIIQWPDYTPLSDTASCLMVGEEKCYALIRKMISFWSSALKSRRIHIGMDEAMDLGRGRYETLNGPARESDLMTRHLARVEEICRDCGMKPIMWSDMFFRMTNPEHVYYTDAPFPAGIRQKLPAGVDLVYWDYYNTDCGTYRKMIRRHRDLGKEPVMGSGIWTWMRLWYDHEKTKSTVLPCIEACRAEKVQEIFFTMWGDDGAYCNYDSSLAGILFAGDAAYGQLDEERTAARFEAICGGDYGAVVVAGGMMTVMENAKGDRRELNPAMLLWDDPLQGIFFDNFRRWDPEFDLRLLDHYEELLCRILPESENRSAGDLAHAVNILQLLIKKLELRGALEAAYDSGDRLALRQLENVTIPATLAALEQFDRSFRRQWMDCAKPQGLERIQARNAGLAARLRETALRIREFLDQEVDNIAELEDRLPPSASLIGFARYWRVSAATKII